MHRSSISSTEALVSLSAFCMFVLQDVWRWSLVDEDGGDTPTHHTTQQTPPLHVFGPRVAIALRIREMEYTSSWLFVHTYIWVAVAVLGRYVAM